MTKSARRISVGITGVLLCGLAAPFGVGILEHPAGFALLYAAGFCTGWLWRDRE